MVVVEEPVLSPVQAILPVIKIVVVVIVRSIAKIMPPAHSSALAVIVLQTATLPPPAPLYNKSFH